MSNAEISQPKVAVINQSQNAGEYEKDAQEVLALMQRSEQLRGQLPSFVTDANAAIAEHHGALPSAFALRFSQSLASANVVRDDLFDQAMRHRSALYRVDEGANDAARVQEIIIAMSAAVTLFENNKIMRDAFQDHALLRSKLNEAYPEYNIAAGFYDSSFSRASNPEYRKAMLDALRYFKDNKAVIERELNQSSPAIQTLYAHIAQSAFLQTLKGGNVFKEIVLLPVNAAVGTVSGMLHFSKLGLNKMKFTSSKLVGNTMGLVRWRDGKLKGDANMLTAMLAVLQPGDILLEKTPFTLTDKSIPGHFGHAAIYVGSLEQLSAMNALDLPVVQKNLAKITEGRGVVEALRSGVQLNKLQDFMNVDDVVILRPKNLKPEDRLESVKLALSNLGKKYDFNFDVNTTDTIVCSELVYIAYPQVDFVTKHVLGSFAITPDDIALKAGDKPSDPLKIVLFGHDGKLVLDATHNENGVVLYDNLVKGAPLKGSEHAAIQRATFKGFVKN